MLWLLRMFTEGGAGAGVYVAYTSDGFDPFNAVDIVPQFLA